MKTILVALDGSERAAAVLETAVELASSQWRTGPYRAGDGAHATLVLFRAFYVPPEVSLAWPLSDRPYAETLRAETETYLRALAPKIPAGVTTEVRVGIGEPWRAVCEAARAVNADLIVMGSHGYEGLDHILGTTAAKVVTHAERSVFVVQDVAA